jgi:hypothetical protein
MPEDLPTAESIKKLERKREKEALSDTGTRELPEE